MVRLRLQDVAHRRAGGQARRRQPLAAKRVRTLASTAGEEAEPPAFLCLALNPTLPERAVIGAKVAVLVQHEEKPEYALGVVEEPAQLRPLRSGQVDDAVFSASRQWKVAWSTRARGPATLSTTQVWDTSDAGLACESLKQRTTSSVLAASKAERDVEAKRRARLAAGSAANAVRQQASTGATGEGRPPRPQQPPAVPPMASLSPDGAPPMRRQRVKPRVAFPSSAAAGTAVRFTVPANYLPGSLAEDHEFFVPARGWRRAASCGLTCGCPRRHHRRRLLRRRQILLPARRRARDHPLRQCSPARSGRLRRLPASYMTRAQTR